MVFHAVLKRYKKVYACSAHYYFHSMLIFLWRVFISFPIKEQSLVNSVSTNMYLRNGMVAKVISDKAGPKLQEACSSLAPIQYGEVKATEGYYMPCKQILHCCLPRWEWEGQATLQVWQYIVNLWNLTTQITAPCCCLHIPRQLHCQYPRSPA